MSVRTVHARHQSRSTSFESTFGDVTLHADTWVDKSKLYTLKRRILSGKTDLNLKDYKHFTLFEDGHVEPMTEHWALRRPEHLAVGAGGMWFRP